MPLQPLANIPIHPRIASLPKVDLHLHQEERARLDRVVARQHGREPYNWRVSAQHLLDAVPPGMTRLAAMYTPDEALPLAGVPDDDPSFIIAKIADALAEGAADGAHYIELRFGAAGLAFMRPDFMALFREAERQVQAQYPHVHAEALAFLPVATDPACRTRTEQHLERCLQLARQGLAGIDLIVAPTIPRLILRSGNMRIAGRSRQLMLD